MIAAAVLGDATAVEMVDVATDDRFTALQSGEIDALVRNTTFTATRDGAEAATFLQPTFYDGQGMMVAADSGFASLEDMDGVIVCVAQGTTTEGNAAAEAARLGVTWEIRPFEDVNLIQEAFVAGQCDGWSSDTSQLTGLRSTYPDGPEALTILPEVFSKEPLTPAVADGDSQWAQAVNWAILATIQAEELGITSENVDTFADTTDVNIQRFLGLEVEGEARARSRARPAGRLRLPGGQPGRELRRDLRTAPRAARPRARRERALDRWRPDVLAAVPLTSTPTSTRNPTVTRRVPLWRDVRVIRWIVQLAVVAVVAAIVIWLYGNYTRNAEQANIPTNFDFLDNPASFQITGNSLSQSAPVRDALIEGLLNTLRVCVAGVIAATILGTLVGIGRLSRNWIVRKIATVYVEVVRNIPLGAVPRRRLARHRPRRVPEHQRGLGLPRADRPLEPRPGRAVVRRRQRPGTAPDPADRRPPLVGGGPVANIGVEPHGRAGAFGPVGRSRVRRGRGRRLVRVRLLVERARRRGARHGAAGCGSIRRSSRCSSPS